MHPRLRFAQLSVHKSRGWGQSGRPPLIMVHDFTPREYYHVLLEYFDVVEEADTAVILERKTPVSFAEVALCVQRHQFDNR